LTVPNTVGSIVAFLFFIVPGVLWNQLRESWRSPAERSAFSEISVTAFVGTAFSSVSTAIVLTVADRLSPAWYATVNQLADGSTTLKRTGLTRVAVLGLIELVGAALLVLLVFALTRRQLYGERKAPVSAWQQVLQEQVPADSRVFAVLQLVDGRQINGEVAGFDTRGTALSDRYLMLGKPISVQSNPESVLPPSPVPWHSFVVTADQIISFAVVYAHVPGAASAPK
jgi:hypothetical protein